MEKTIKSTTNYSIFKRLEGNRPIKDHRVDKIVQSILKIGYVTSPILVNEKMEVIDGQGRLSALEKLSLPVEYIVQEGLGIEECRQMNIHQSNWTDYDYINSYALIGNDNYKRLQSLFDTYDLPSGAIIASALGENIYGGRVTNKVRGGQIKVTEEDYERAKWELSYAENLKQVAKSVGGKTLPFYIAVFYAYRSLSIAERQKLEEVLRKHKYEIPSLTKAGDYLRYFDEFYNYNLSKKNRIHLSLQWQTDHI